MGAAFAIQVMTGKEAGVKRMLDWAFERNKTAQKCVMSVHAFTQGTRRLLGNNKLGKRVERPTIPGYVFLEMNQGEDCDLPADLWHLIKSVPGVLKLFGNAGQLIGYEAFENLVATLDTEDQVEAGCALVDNEAELKTAVHNYNVAESPEQKNIIETQLQEIEAQKTASEQLDELRETSQKPTILNRINAILKHKKEVIRFPFSLFIKTADRIDPHGVLPYNRIYEANFIFPHVLETLRLEVNLN